MPLYKIAVTLNHPPPGLEQSQSTMNMDYTSARGLEPRSEDEGLLSGLWNGFDPFYRKVLSHRALAFSLSSPISAMVRGGWNSVVDA